MAAPLQTTTISAGAWSLRRQALSIGVCQRQRRARTLSPRQHHTAWSRRRQALYTGEYRTQRRARIVCPPPPRTTQQQLQACSTKSELHSGSDTMHNQKDVSASILHRL